MSSQTPSYKPLPAPRRIVTTHNAAGQAILTTGLAPELPKGSVPGTDLYLAYTSPSLPAPLPEDADLDAYKTHLTLKPPLEIGIDIPGGLAARVVDFLPGGPGAPMHRTETLDTGVLVEGELELVLDSGETAILKRGDVYVQRGTMHGWRNVSETEVARLFVVLTAAEMPVFGGEKLKEVMPVPPTDSEAESA
ncbi:uncharacterized protein CCOS01_09453 [Colletotrichum costaricense]|uniref:Cupin type-2 domain-containing protein n=2 Tax=Colletotrichum acutatum species complex TaxID=2707335 RepID=A0AAI9YUT3_9PEZI|nr:uncharacterized protein CCOS01_09453 [Colletotrichum costaricense]KAK1524366.1 hypothetical protein CCOS01_09453 [Colletotrichum costaricense]